MKKIIILKIDINYEIDWYSSLQCISQRIFIQYEIITWECEN